MEALEHQRCVPCEGGTSPMGNDEVEHNLKQISDWTKKEQSIEKNFVFNNFVKAVSFVNAVALISENEGHHPDISIFSYKNVKINLSTHSIKGLSQNDFILAAKIDKIRLS